jgi:hypothetical protein
LGGVGDGELLRAAQRAAFAVMVSGDKNLSFQQNLQLLELALVVLRTNNWNVLKHQSQLVLDAVDAAKPGSVQLVSFGAPVGGSKSS